MTNYTKAMLILIFISFLICVTSFSSFNTAYKLNIDLNQINMVDINGNIENCKVSNGSIIINGWAIPRKYMGTPYKGNYFVIVTMNGIKYKIRANRTLRKDVSKFYKTEKIYDYTGFSSSYKSILNGKIDKDIILVTEKNGKMWGISNECK